MKTKKVYTICVVVLLLGILIGYIWGTATTLNICINIGERLLDIKLKPDAISKLAGRYPEVLELLGG